ncbi:MAG: riboflavin synthase [Thermodesulfobacteriota bacterium]|nr:riboflavin synthase [Thermodesulfobacteriota bacterium]
MFTGIIEGFGTIQTLRSEGRGKRIRVSADIDLQGTAVGDSIAVNGACLTVVALSGNIFEADAAPETLARTTLGRVRGGEKVNLERALRFSDRLDGHIVTGHIDGTGVIRSKRRLDNAVIVTVDAGKELAGYIVKKGSVAVDGISLTVNDCGDDFFEVSIIPHTAAITTIGFRNSGDPVNIETDIIGKYVAHFLFAGRPQGAPDGEKKKEAMPTAQGISRELLAKSGFL